MVVREKGIFQNNAEYAAQVREDESNKALQNAGYIIDPETGGIKLQEGGGFEVQQGTQADLQQQQTQNLIQQQQAQLHLIKNQTMGNTIQNMTQNFVETGDANVLQDGILENPHFAERLQAKGIYSVSPVNWSDPKDLSLLEDEIGSTAFNTLVKDFKDENGNIIIPEDLKRELNSGMFLMKDAQGKPTIGDINDLDAMLNKNTRKGKLLSQNLQSINETLNSAITKRLTPTADMQNAQYLAGLKTALTGLNPDSEEYSTVSTLIKSMESTMMTSKEKDIRTGTKVAEQANPFTYALDTGNYDSISNDDLLKQINVEQGVDKSLFTSPTGDWAKQGQILSTLKDGIELNNKYIQTLSPTEWKRTYDDTGKYLNLVAKYTKTDAEGNASIDPKDMKALLRETSVNTRMGKYFAAYLKDTSGTAVADAEFARLMKVVTGGEGANLEVFKKAFSEFVSATKDSLINSVKSTAIGKEANTVKRLRDIGSLKIDYNEPISIKKSEKSLNNFPKFKEDEPGIIDRATKWTKDTFNSLWN